MGRHASPYIWRPTSRCRRPRNSDDDDYDDEDDNVNGSLPPHPTPPTSHSHPETPTLPTPLPHHPSSRLPLFPYSDSDVLYFPYWIFYIFGIPMFCIFRIGILDLGFLVFRFSVLSVLSIQGKPPTVHNRSYQKVYNISYQTICNKIISSIDKYTG